MLLLLVALLMMDGSSGDGTAPPLDPLGADDTQDILRIKRHRTMPHRGG